jgi:hypothetical protein
VQRTVPKVLRVYSNQSGVFSQTEAITIYVQMSASVFVVGAPTLALDLPTYPLAVYTSLATANTLTFRYVVQGTDCTSSLDYLSSAALSFASSSLGLYDGVYLLSSHVNVTANLTLPPRGAEGSLGREAALVIDNGRPDVVRTYARPSQSTSGDAVSVVVRYSEAMGVFLRSDGARYSGALSLAVGLQLSIHPADAAQSVQLREAVLDRVDANEVVFVYHVTSGDPTGAIHFSSASPLLFNGTTLKAEATGTDGPQKLADSMTSVVLATIDNNAPFDLCAPSLPPQPRPSPPRRPCTDNFLSMCLTCFDLARGLRSRVRVDHLSFGGYGWYHTPSWT